MRPIVTGVVWNRPPRQFREWSNSLADKFVPERLLSFSQDHNWVRRDGAERLSERRSIPGRYEGSALQRNRS
jgi:hypothetical protein